MSRYFIFAQSTQTAKSLGAWLELLGEEPIEEVGDRLKDERVVFASSAPNAAADFVRCFNSVAGSLDKSLAGCPAGEAVVLVDSVNPDQLNAVGSAGGWNRLISLLILAFPEARWVFGVTTGISEGDLDRWSVRHGLPSLLGPAYNPLFDGIGLRAHIRNKTWQQGDHKIAPWIPQRQKWAAAIDDESAYAHFHAYTAYRHGYRAFAVDSFSLGECLFGGKEGSEEQDRWELGTCDLTLEDLYLGYPDKNVNTPMAILDSEDGKPCRNSQWSRLKDKENTRTRHFITTGIGVSQKNENEKLNRQYRRNLRDDNRGGLEAKKPTSGIFGLWHELKLDRTLHDRDEFGKIYRESAPGFFWPPNKNHSVDNDEGGGHSAPGLLLLVSQTLIERATSLFSKVESIQDALKGAVMATSALELLGPKTPGTAREALILKHCFEVKAECLFGGVQHGIDLKQRFAEINNEVKLLSQWFGRENRKVAGLDIRLSIICRLKRIFNEHDEFEDEEICRREVAILKRQLWLRKKKPNPLEWLAVPIVWPLRTYIEYLMGSLTRLVTAIFAWIVVLTGLFALLPLIPSLHLAIQSSNEPMSSSMLPLWQSWFSFFASEPSHINHWAWFGLTALTSLTGFIHLGVFIAQLYTNLSRR